MKPFFTFYGGKWRAAPRYPAPTRETIVEPFAGAAGYSVRHHGSRVILVEKDARIAALWRYLIAASPDEIMSLPDIRHDQTIDDLGLPDGPRWLVGFWLNKGSNGPRRSPGAWMRSGTHNTSFWGPAIRARVASQVDAIKHWTVIHGDYSDAPDIEATWFIDPPYKGAGSIYKHSSREIDFDALASWCRSRRGQVMVCENDGANWLPFEYFMDAKSTEGRRGKSVSKEAIWRN